MLRPFTELDLHITLQTSKFGIRQCLPAGRVNNFCHPNYKCYKQISWQIGARIEHQS